MRWLFWKRRAGRIVVSVLILGGGLLPLVSSCALLRPGTVEGPPSKVWQPGELLQALAQRERQFRSLRSLAKVRYSGTEGRTAFEEAVLVQRPDRLRLETLSSLGAVLVVTTDGKEIVGFHPREGLFYRGASTKENIFRYTHMPLELGELTSLLMGLPPSGGRQPWREAGNQLQKNLGDGGREISEWNSSADAPAKWERISTDGKLVLRAVFSDFTPTPAGSFPLKITLETSVPRRSLEIRYQEPELNADLPPPLFVQEKPAGVREIPLESLGG